MPGLFLFFPGSSPFATLPRLPTLRNGSPFQACVLVTALLTWSVVAGFAGVRSSPLTVFSGAGAKPEGLRAVPAALAGLHFTNALSPRDASRNQILLNGSGVAAGDYDGDGRVDLFFANLRSGGRLLRNLGGWRFQDATLEVGLGSVLAALPLTGTCFADVDGDGDLDLLVNAMGGGTRLFLNQGGGRFVVATNAGLDDRSGATSLALADIDADGDLDLYVANYRTNTIRSTGFSVYNLNGRRMIRPEDRDRLEYLPDGRVLEHGEPDQLYLNDGTGHFSAQSWTDGRFVDEQGKPLAAPLRDWSLSVAFHDLDGDGSPDLYVCGDFHSPDRIWLNDGHGRFRAAPPTSVRNSPTFSMAVDFADVDQDGTDDFFVADMLDPRREFRMVQSAGLMAIAGDYESTTNRPQLARNVLQLGRGDGTFAEAAGYAGLEALGWTWSVAFLDVDLDGRPDLLAAAGQMFDTQDADARERIEAAGPYRPEEIPGKLLRYPPLDSPKRAYRNLGELRFRDAAQAWGWDDQPGIWQSISLADLDNDGDLDVVVHRLNGPPGLYENLATAPRVAVRLKGPKGNPFAVGARIELLGGAQPRQRATVTAGGRYLAGDDTLRVFAAGSATQAMRLEVTWPGGARSQVDSVQPNHLYEIEPEAAPARTNLLGSLPSPPTRAPLFGNESARLGYRHYDAPDAELERQPMLARRQGQAGPGVGWVDLDGDGRDDLVIASGRGGRPGIFHNAGAGRFELVEPDPAARDQVGVASWPVKEGTTLALVAATADEAGAPNRAELRAYRANGESTTLFSLPSESIGPLAVADFDGDGDLDILAGGRAVGGRYPEASPSVLLEQHGTELRVHEPSRAALAQVGLVNAACWADLDADGWPELLLAGEWGPLRVFRHRAGRLEEATAELGLDRWTGWWTGIAVGDFDEDGQPDIVVGNWGLNSLYRAAPEHPVRLYYGDLSGQGRMDLVEASFEPSLGQWAPDRDLNTLAASLPWLRAAFPTHRQFAAATMEAVLASAVHPARIAEARTLATTVFLRRGARFEAVPLPLPAQLAPVFGVAVADFDLDGHLDVFLAQNFFAVAPVIGRQDAGRGLLLLGDGHGGWRALDAAESGIAAYGEQRGVAVGDYDGDGRPDLVLGQNRAETLLLHNLGARPGTRVRLRGPAGNPTGAGAAVTELRSDGSRGWRREVPTAGGYGSQSSSVFCVPSPTSPVDLEVLWPGGTRSVHRGLKPSGKRELVLEFPSPQPLPR